MTRPGTKTKQRQHCGPHKHGAQARITPLHLLPWTRTGSWRRC
jgi:hypothetical protein